MKGKITGLSKREIKNEILSRLGIYYPFTREYSNEALLNDFEDLCKTVCLKSISYKKARK